MNSGKESVPEIVLKSVVPAWLNFQQSDSPSLTNTSHHLGRKSVADSEAIQKTELRR